MKLLNVDEFLDYLRSNHKLLMEGFGRPSTESSEFDGYCDNCKKDVFLKTESIEYSHSPYGSNNLEFYNLMVECPRCKRKRIIQIAQIKYYKKVETKDDDDDKEYYEVYKLNSIPTLNEEYSVKSIPNKYDNLINTVNEANFCLDHGKYISATILYRRALEIIAKPILGAKGRMLYNQLEWLKVNENKLKIDLSELFHDNSKLIKDVGNQGAHPAEDDVSLQNFNEDDVNLLHDLFLIIVHEIFVKPEKLKSMQEELKAKRKIK